MEVRNNLSPNFGMALRIKPEAVDALKRMSRSELETIEKAAEKIKDTQFWHLEIGKDGKRIISSPFADKYAGDTLAFKEPHDEFLTYSALWKGTQGLGYKEGDTVSGAIKFENKEAAMNAYKDLSKYFGGIEKDAKFVKYMDDRAIAKAEQNAAERAEREAICKKVNQMFEKYGVS